ncbi:class F sortase [Streptomyces aurantiacus]|uniref:class F sortase n=1 Tax=Streptomyces aurantiacus TaxID=47760 RepID=UPI00099886B7|nr:class F sortase [Streptomyces aurantiacus]
MRHPRNARPGRPPAQSRANRPPSARSRRSRGARLTLRGRRVLACCAAVFIVVGLVLTARALFGEAGPPQPPQSQAPGRAGKEVGDPPAAAPLPPSKPVGLRIPSISVSAPVADVGLRRDGQIQEPPPEKRNLTAWYRDSPSPGSAGTAVIVGHVDDSGGPAVFYGLGALRAGSSIEVRRRDGKTAVFRVYGVKAHSKRAFPVREVYGDRGRPELRLITCGGTYSKKAGYSGNVVAYAYLVGTR